VVSPDKINGKLRVHCERILNKKGKPPVALGLVYPDTKQFDFIQNDVKEVPDVYGETQVSEG
jgi:hypothetical protein